MRLTHSSASMQALEQIFPGEMPRQARGFRLSMAEMLTEKHSVTLNWANSKMVAPMGCDGAAQS